jgi:SpoVK/Ycf46/Vps4 family AAA+-type ATPase
VARIYGSILTALKVLPKGQFVEVTRQDLVVGYFGHTAPKTTEVFMSALGGVLFIDEAHTLSRTFAGSNRDFGQEAIDTLVKLMEDHREEIVVIAAGYTGDMVGFLAANPGLASRFARTIEFDSYTPDELIEISRYVTAASDYVLDPLAETALQRHFATLSRDEHFGNAREVRKLFEAVRKAQARRLRRLGHRPDLDELRTLIEADLRAAVELNRTP